MDQEITPEIHHSTPPEELDPTISQIKNSWTHWIVFYTGILLLGAAAFAGVYFSVKNQAKNPQITSEQTPKATQSSAPVDQTANWKTYKTFVAGYEIKYPSGFVREYEVSRSSTPDLISSVSIEVNFNGRTIPFVIETWKNLGVTIKDTESREQWCGLLQKELTGQMECGSGQKFLESKVSTYLSFQASGGRGNLLVKVIYIPHNNYVYKLTVPVSHADGTSYPISDQILSTFKFQ